MLTYERQTRKPIPFSYHKNPGSIGEHIRKRRMDLNLLQKDVAKMLGVTEGSIKNGENNRGILSTLV